MSIKSICINMTLLKTDIRTFTCDQVILKCQYDMNHHNEINNELT